MIDSTSPMLVVYTCIEILVGFISILGNSVVLFVIIRTRALHIPTNIFIANLAIADIGVGIVAIPGAFSMLFGLPSNIYMCILIHCAMLAFTNVSILMLLVIAMDRFIAIRFPFMYDKYANNSSANTVNILTWTFGAILGTSPILHANRAALDPRKCSFSNIVSTEYMVYFQFLLVTMVPLVIMFAIYLYIYFIVRRHAAQTLALEELFTTRSKPSRKRRRFGKDVKAAIMFAKIVFLFSVLWLPVHALHCMKLICPTCKRPFIIILVAIILTHINSCVNPILYAANNSRIRSVIKDIIHLKTAQRSFDSNSPGFTSFTGRSTPIPAFLPRMVAGQFNCRNIDGPSLQSQELSENIRNEANARVTFVNAPLYAPSMPKDRLPGPS